MLNKKYWENISIGTHICSYCHQAVKLLTLTKVMWLGKLCLFRIIHSHVRELSAHWKRGRHRYFFFVFRYVHFVMMWNTFLMVKFLHNEHATSVILTVLVQLQHIPLLSLVFSMLDLPAMSFFISFSCVLSFQYSQFSFLVLFFLK
jgi:hypothetical protein